MENFQSKGYLFDPDEFIRESIKPPLVLPPSNLITEVKDDTLMFMTMAVTMTARNEMPIVPPYQGAIPLDIRAYHRVSNLSSNVAPHFFFSDNRNLRYFNAPFKTEKALRRFNVSISMDFSMTQEMTKPQKMYSSFLNKLWDAWLTTRGHLVIPNISFPCEYEEDYWIEGWPADSVIAVSSVGVLRHGDPSVWLRAVERINDELHPRKIIRYGSYIPGETTVNCIYFKNDNNRAYYGC